jgi:very-short-patch-repair endonuclease
LFFGELEMSQNTPVLKNAKVLRKTMTEAETILWESLRNRKLGNMKFRRQEPMVFGGYHFVADFYCAEKRLVIEVDGGIHNEPDVHEQDVIREDVFRYCGYEILRFTNEEVRNEIGKVLKRIEDVFQNLPRF